MIDSASRSLGQLVGEVVGGIRRVFYVFRGTVASDFGPVELSFASGAHLLLDVGPDGALLAAALDQWVDPFSDDAMTPENRAFVEKSGKWTAFNVADDPEYSHLIGARIESIVPILASSGELIGVDIETSRGGIRAEVEFDDLAVRLH